MEEKKDTKKPERKIAVIRIRGLTGVRKDIKDTLDMLNLFRKNYCVVLKETPENLGMINKVKDFITWGYVSDEVVSELVKKKGEPDPKDNKKTKHFFRMHPPRGGFERKGTKVGFNIGGALGFRADKIDELIKKMM